MKAHEVLERFGEEVGEISEDDLKNLPPPDEEELAEQARLDAKHEAAERNAEEAKPQVEVQKAKSPLEEILSRPISPEILRPTVTEGEAWPRDPKDLAHVPGAVGEVILHILETARHPDRFMALAAALSAVGKILDRRIIGPTGAGTWLYVLTLAFTGSGKEHLLNCITKVLEEVASAEKIGPSDFASVQAIQEMMELEPSVLALMDEFGSFIARITHGSQSSNVQEITGMLSSFWGKQPGANWRGPKKKGKPIETVSSPALSIFAVSTPTQFYEAVKSKFIATGFLNRFLIISVGRGGARAEPSKDWRKLPDSLKAKLMAMSRLHASESIGGVFWRQVPWAVDGAAERFGAFHDSNWSMPDGRDRDVRIRTAEIAVRLATIMAVGRGSTKVERADLEWALALADQSAVRLIEDLEKYSREQLMFGDLCDKILEVLRRANGFALRSDLLVALRGNIAGLKEINEALDYLRESRQIVVAKMKDEAAYSLVKT
jgi:hypothetical protein